MELLEDEAYLVAPDGREVLGVEAGDLFAVQNDGAVGGLVHASHNVQHGGLAGAGRAHDGDPLALLHREVDVLQGLDRAVDHGDVLEFENVLFHVRSPCYSPRRTREGSTSVARITGMSDASTVTAREAAMVRRTSGMESPTLRPNTLRLTAWAKK